ncbi:TrkH-domain-containing protein [Macrolepiota fuliginosa MF-IS2]|uniref:TrkH-domain-containing protein n=1 Tax=Macrolepiota fuliginosa MF-IS2 TaxID=1400762 RepID=A0A9P6C2N9_9AGAR|nr:TrkH-domain-containing protein [Macrolepiota fuliginosa MF-IS2]
MADPPPPKWSTRLWSGVKNELNFYRIHLIYFTVTPLFFSGIFYASNGRYHVEYIDALFNCFSSMCVCGLTTVNLSELTPWQQGILFIQMQLGNPVFVSWFMVLVRRHYFAREFEHMLVSEIAKKALDTTLKGEEPKPEEHRPWPHRMAALLRPGKGLSVVAEEDSSEGSKTDRRDKHGIIRKLRPDMIRRMDDAPKLVNPSGWVTEGKAPSLRQAPTLRSRHSRAEEDTSGNPLGSPSMRPQERSPEMSRSGSGGGFPRQQTIEFAPTLQRPRGRPEQPRISESDSDSTSTDLPNQPTSDLRSVRRPSLGPHYTVNTMHTTHSEATHRSRRSAKNRGYGGFPMPLDLIGWAINKFFPRFKRRLSRTVTIPVTTSLVSTRVGQRAPAHGKPVPYISFDAIVGRNSAFHLLTNEQLEEIGGVEYRALNVLLWAVAGYLLGIQLITYTIIGPYMAMGRWKSALEPPNEVRPVANGWFSLFQVTSSFTNTGSSLVDQSMIPFQTAYVLIVFQVLLILGGNCAYVTCDSYCAYILWIITKMIPRDSRLNETLHFLLDHPRRCYTYLFPSHQTWFLLTVVLLLTFVDWSFFLLLDIGNSVIAAIPLHTRFAVGLFQAVAVRAAGFAIVPMNSIAPAVKVLYMVMMYISICAVRSTNVYEEQSLGIFKDNPEPEEEEFQPSGSSRMHIWSRYLAMHARRQLAFDMWWLFIAVFLICIIERHKLNNPDNYVWFNIFNIMFEVVSAYGTVGLSLGIPDQNYSLSGAFGPLSKLVICIVILRGRHRGLPVAIDRAILLPSELQNCAEADGPPVTETDARSHRTQRSHGTGAGYTNPTRYSRPDSMRGNDGGSEHFPRRSVRRGSSSTAGMDYEPTNTAADVWSHPASSLYESPVMS